MTHATPLTWTVSHRSLVEWLVLGGVSTETNNSPVSHLIKEDILDSDLAPVTASKPAARTPSPTSQAPQVQITLDKFNSLEDLNNFSSTWKGIGLAKTASKAVAGRGPMQPRLMVIGDFPDDSEDRSGLAFSSPVNQPILQALRFAGFAEEKIYFTYLSKWRTPARRNLTPPERDICAQFLMQEIGLVAPQAILVLGESGFRLLAAESGAEILKNPVNKILINQLINKKLPIMASQKAEFLVKNPAMKKSFWFSLLDLAATCA